MSQKIYGISLGAAVSQPSTRQAALASLTATLAKLHALPVQEFNCINPLVVARATWNSQFERPGFPAWALTLSARLARVEQVIALCDRQVLAHGDLNPSNVLWDGTRVWFIDWDGAGLCHPYLDLATISNFLSLPDEAATALLGMQEQSAVDTEEVVLFYAYRNLMRIVYGSLFLSMIADLKEVGFASQSMTPTLPQCFSRMVAGELNMASTAGRAQLGAAFFKQCV